MAPNAEQLRLRTTVYQNTNSTSSPTNTSSTTNNDDSSITTTNNHTHNTETLKKLISKLHPNEVVIDGTIYDLTSFHHPGGDSILLFGGNDATVQYKMIHPYHKPQHLRKMRKVGTIPHYTSEYKFDTPFEREIKREVFKICAIGKEFGTTGYFCRAACYLVFFFAMQVMWVRESSYQLAVVYGVAMALIGLNVQHDANHGAASRKVWVNDLLGLGADLIGGSKWLWMEKHWTHHAFTNHHENDPDGMAAEPVLIFNDYSPTSPKRKPFHAYQGFYLIFIISGYWISSVFDLAQVWDLRDRGALNVGIHLDHPWIQTKAKYAVALRLLHILLNVLLPLYNAPTLTTLAHINLLGISGSLALGLLFTLSHNFEHSDRDPTAESRHSPNHTGVCWFKAQVETSSTYGGTMSGWLTGGLNFQVEHHLFPRMSSAWYPVIAPVVRRVCKKHGVRYVYYPWIWQNMVSTVRYTHNVGNGMLRHLEGNPFKGEQ